MNKQQTVQQKISVEKYLEQNKLRPLFHQLTKLLLLKKPEDPIEFLKQYLQKRNKRQIICIHGYQEQSRAKIAKTVSNKFNFLLIQLAELFKDSTDWHSKRDQQINDKVLSQINKVESVYKGIIISGYPNNIVQANFIQKSGFLPERYFVMENDQEQIRQAYGKLYQGHLDKLIERNRLQLKELNSILANEIDFLPKDLQKATNRIIHTLSLKSNKKSIPYESLKILVLYPPYLKPVNSELFTNLYSLNGINLNSALKQLSNKQEFITHVESYIRKHNCISKQIELAMIQTMAKSVASKNKGFALYGWPLKKDRVPLLKEHFLNPHLVLIFNEHKDEALKKFQDLNPDDETVFSITKKPSKQEYSKLFDEYQQMTEELKGKNNVHVFSYSQSEQKIIKTFNNLIQNPKIYS